MLRDIVLHGALGEKFGREFRLNVASPAQALRALTLQLDGFAAHFRKGRYRVLATGADRAFALDEDTFSLQLGRLAEIHFVPVIAGAGGGTPSTGRDTTKIVAGVALMAIALAGSALVPGGFSLTATLLDTPITTGMLAAVGLGIALSGVAGLLTKPNQGDNSFIFSGQDNVTTQGGPVPIVVGQLITGGVIISAGLQAYDLVVGSSSALAFDPSAAPNVSYYSTDPNG